jgi:hypothetical protein
MADEVIKIENIVDGDSLKSWLTDWPVSQGLDENKARQIAISIAHRAAMRVMPVLWEYTLSDDGRKRELIAWPYLRSLLISGVTAKCLSPEKFSRATERAIYAIADAQHDARAATDVHTTDVHTPGTRATMDAAARVAIGAAASASAIYANTARDLHAAATHAVTPKYADQWAAVRFDCAAISREADVSSIPLWPAQENPLSDVWTSIKSQVSEPEWEFWIKWYDDALAGRPPNWEVLEQIALIDSKDWDAGPVAVDERIDLIVRQHELLADVHTAKATLAKTRSQAATLLQRSHNNPPEMVGLDVAVIDRVEILWTALEQAEDELEKPLPSPSKLKSIGFALLEVCKKITAYCADLADRTLKKSAEGFGSTAGKLAAGGVAAYWAAQSTNVQSIASQLMELASKLVH